MHHRLGKERDKGEAGERDERAEQNLAVAKSVDEDTVGEGAKESADT